MPGDQPTPKPICRNVTDNLPLKAGITCWRHTYGLVFSLDGHAVADLDVDPAEKLTVQIVAERMGERWPLVSDWLPPAE